MYAQHSTAGQVPAGQFIIALQRLDTETQEAIQRNVMRYVARSNDWRLRIETAIQQQADEQRQMDQWADLAAEADLLRHPDPYALSKEGDGAYWTQ